MEGAGIKRKEYCSRLSQIYHCLTADFLPFSVCVCVCVCVCVSHSIMSDSLRPHELQPTRLFCPWNSPGKNTGMGCHSLLQGIFPTQGLNQGLLHCRRILCHLSHQGNPNLPKSIPTILYINSSFQNLGSHERQTCQLWRQFYSNYFNKVYVC